MQTLRKKTFVQFYLTSAILIIVFGEKRTLTHMAADLAPLLGFSKLYFPLLTLAHCGECDYLPPIHFSI